MSIAFSLSIPAPTHGGKMRAEANIGEMAREFDVSLRTLRFYEDRGLLQPRRHGASRFYGEADRRRMQAILKGKQLGFTLTEIRDLIGAPQAEAGEADIEETLRPEQIVDQICHLERQRDEIAAAIDRLRATHERRAAAPALQSV
jgi:DNA-binding transcriptional MerR regulator